MVISGGGDYIGLYQRAVGTLGALLEFCLLPLEAEQAMTGSTFQNGRPQEFCSNCIYCS